MYSPTSPVPMLDNVTTPARWAASVAGVALTLVLGLWPVKATYLVSVPCGPTPIAVLQPWLQANGSSDGQAVGTLCFWAAAPFAAGATVTLVGTIVLLVWPRRRPHFAVTEKDGSYGCISCGRGWPCRTAWEAGGPVYIR